LLILLDSHVSFGILSTFSRCFAIFLINCDNLLAYLTPMKPKVHTVYYTSLGSSRSAYSTTKLVS
jgi:hypothetical protein